MVCVSQTPRPQFSNYIARAVSALRPLRLWPDHFSTTFFIYTSESIKFIIYQKHFSSVNFGLRLHQGLVPEALNSKVSWGAYPRPPRVFCPWPDHFKIADGPKLDSDENEDGDNTEQEREHCKGLLRTPCNNLHVILYRIMN